METWCNIIFIVGFISIFAGFFCRKKSKKPLHGVLWLGITVVLILCFHTLAAAVLQWLSIPIDAGSLGLADFITGAVLLVCSRKDGRQTYVWKKTDFLCLAAMVMFCIVLACLRFGTKLDFSYRSVDAITHYYEAVMVYRTGCIKDMYFTAVNDSIFVSFLAPFWEITKMYQMEPIADTFYLILAGWIFIGVVEEKCKKPWSLLAGFVLELLYMFGYPYNNLLAGFLYLGIGVMIILVICVIAEKYFDNELKEGAAIAALMLCCTGLITCYCLFVPIVYLTLGCIHLWRGWKYKCPLKDVIANGIYMFALPCIIGIFYTYRGIFSNGVTVDSAINLEGYIYRNYYKDFLPLIPVALIGIWACLKKKKNPYLVLLAAGQIFCMFLMYYGVKNGIVSEYYYAKNNYFFWLLLFLLCIEAVREIEKKSIVAVFLGYCISWSILAVYVFEGDTNVEDEKDIAYYGNVFWYNKVLLSGKIDENKAIVELSPQELELFEWVYGECEEKGKRVFPVARGSERYFFNAVSGQWDVVYLHIDHDTYKDLLLEEKPDYIYVRKDFSVYKKNKEYFNSFPKVFENEIGFVSEYGEFCEK